MYAGRFGRSNGLLRVFTCLHLGSSEDSSDHYERHIVGDGPILREGHDVIDDVTGKRIDRFTAVLSEFPQQPAVAVGFLFAVDGVEKAVGIPNHGIAFPERMGGFFERRVLRFTEADRWTDVQRIHRQRRVWGMTRGASCPALA